MQAVSHDTLSFGKLLQVEGVVEELEIRGTVGFCAFHGGNLERVTDHIARSAAQASGASYYSVLQPPGLRVHIPSAKVDPAQSEKLRRFIQHCDVVFAIHGYGRAKHWATVPLGGRNRKLAQHVAHHLRWHLPAYKILDHLEDIPKALRGQHRDNPCNLSSGGGVQIELPPRIRGLSPMAKFWPATPTAEDQHFAHTQDLVAGLASAARDWPRVA